MKKILILLVSVILLFFAWYLMYSFEDNVSEGKPNVKKKVSITQQSYQVDSNTEVNVNDAVNEIDSNHEEENVGCAKKLAIEFPELNQKFEEAFTEIYLTKTEMMGDDEYAYLDEQSLESLAYANDIKAMLYFSEKLIARSLNQENVESASTTINYENFEEGIRLKWNVVVKARPALLSEIADKYMYRAGIEINRDQNKSSAIQSLATAKAYLLLIQKVFEKDPPLMRLFSNLEDFNERVDWVLRNDAHKDDLIKQISEKASALNQDLVNKWEQERAYHGKEFYPDFFNPEVEGYAEKLERQCHP